MVPIVVLVAVLPLGAEVGNLLLDAVGLGATAPRASDTDAGLRPRLRPDVAGDEL